MVTDRDFSKAYFHSAWAARFLERTFSKYVVLFVGYSHSDVVMKYLGLGLGPRAERYVVTDDPSNQIWRRLRVTVLEYPAKQHQVLTECLMEWANLGDMGLLEHRQWIRNIVSNSSGEDQSLDLLTTPAELSYQVERLGLLQQLFSSNHVRTQPSFPRVCCAARAMCSCRGFAAHVELSADTPVGPWCVPPPQAASRKVAHAGLLRRPRVGAVLPAFGYES